MISIVAQQLCRDAGSCQFVWRGFQLPSVPSRGDCIHLHSECFQITTVVHYDWGGGPTIIVEAGRGTREGYLSEGWVETMEEAEQMAAAAATQSL